MDKLTEEEARQAQKDFATGCDHTAAQAKIIRWIVVVVATRVRDRYQGSNPSLPWDQWPADLLGHVATKLMAKKWAPEKGSIHAWLAVVARNFFFDWSKGPAPRPQADQALERQSQNIGDDQTCPLEALEAGEELVGWLESLPDKQQRVVLLKILGLNNAAIAARLGITVTYVGTLLHRARKQLSRFKRSN